MDFIRDAREWLVETTTGQRTAGEGEMIYTKREWKTSDKDGNGAINIYSDVRFREGLIAIVYDEADAHLIAAAPDMYEALKAISKQFRASHIGVGIALSQKIKAGEKALAKAES